MRIVTEETFEVPRDKYEKLSRVCVYICIIYIYI